MQRQSDAITENSQSESRPIYELVGHFRGLEKAFQMKLRIFREII